MGARLAALAGAAVCAAWSASGLTGLVPAPPDMKAAAPEAARIILAAAHPRPVEATPASSLPDTGAAVGDAAIGEPGLLVPDPPSVQVATASPDLPVPSATLPSADPVALASACTTDDCIDDYLWAAYQRAPKRDTIRVAERIKVTVKRKGKTRTVVKTITRLVDEDFTWKDPKAAERAGMSLEDYVIGGMDRGFKRVLYDALRAADAAGLAPAITSGFRDDYRQEIASGHKAASNRSWHGGSLRGGYGHGLAADIVSVNGATRTERWVSTEALWKWIDAHGREHGIARPYLDRDPPHVGPIDGKEYADHRGAAKTRTAQGAAKSRTAHRAAKRSS
jgi:hypothetical protein